MKSKKIIASFCLILGAFAACGKPKNTDLAAQAMERARAAEAPLYAPEEFAAAEGYYSQMNTAVNEKNNKDATAYADQTVEAANKAAARARENKATQLIGELTALLEEAQRQGIPNTHGQVYNQAVQSHIDAMSFQENQDYEKAIQAAELGISVLKPLISQRSAEARDLLEKARSRYESVSSSIDTDAQKDMLTRAESEIDTAAEAYGRGDYNTTITHAQNALDILNELAASLERVISQPIGRDNLQLQAYQLLRQLEETIAYLKENGYTNDVRLGGQETPKEEFPSFTVPAQVQEEPSPNEDEIFIFMEEAEETEEGGEAMFSYRPLLLRAQMADEEAITFAMIEEKYAQAKAAYDEANHINSIDSSREGLRLADLFLAGQSIASHKVVKGNTLWGIAGRYYNRRFLLWPHIWTANKFQIKDPDLIYPEQVFRIPPPPQSVK